MRVDTVVFDIGNVLISWDPRNLYRKIFTDAAEMEFFLAEVCPMAWNVEQDRGRSWDEAIAEAIGRHPGYAAPIRAYRARWHEMIAGEIAGSVRVLNDLRSGGVPVYAITNFAHDTFADAVVAFPFLTGFRDVVVSAAEGLLKPDPAIYRVLFDRNGLDPRRCVFIDDSPANVATARALGMAGILFSPATELAAELQAIGVSIPSDLPAG